MRGLLRCNINTGVHARARRADVSLRDVTIARDEEQGYRVWMTSRTGSARRILGIWRKLVELRTGHRTRRLTFACSRRPLWRVLHVFRGGWKSQNKKIVPLSPFVEKPLNSKVIKSFVPEQRSRQVFFEFRDSYVLSLWTFDVRFTHSHIMAMVQNRKKIMSVVPQLVQKPYSVSGRISSPTVISLLCSILYLPNPSARAGYDTRSIF